MIAGTCFIFGLLAGTAIGYSACNKVNENGQRAFELYMFENSLCERLDFLVSRIGKRIGGKVTEGDDCLCLIDSAISYTFLKYGMLRAKEKYENAMKVVYNECAERR